MVDSPSFGGSVNPAPHVSFPPSENGGVDGQAQRLVAGGRRPLDEIGDEAPIPPHVDLEPQPGGTDRGHFFDRPGPECRQRIRQSGPRRRSGHRQFAGGIGDAGEPGRGQDERQRQRLSEQARGDVDLADIAQHPRPEGHAAVGLAIGGQGQFVFGASVDVVEDSAGEPALGDRAKVGHRHRSTEPALSGAQLGPAEAKHAQRGSEAVALPRW